MQRSESSRGTGKRKAARLESKRLGYFLTIPSSILILAISFYPLIQGISLSFESYNLMKPKKRKFVGFDNFKELLFSDNEFHSVLFYSFVYTIAVVLLAYVFGLFLATLAKTGYQRPWNLSDAGAFALGRRAVDCGDQLALAFK